MDPALTDILKKIAQYLVTSLSRRSGSPWGFWCSVCDPADTPEDIEYDDGPKEDIEDDGAYLLFSGIFWRRFWWKTVRKMAKRERQAVPLSFCPPHVPIHVNCHPAA
ncbi:hypothetical protein K439DRAFT_1629206, partial [Ramaria rubella]